LKGLAVNQKKQIAVIVGSLRTGSINRKVAETLVRTAPDSLALRIVEIGHLPLYNQDYDADSPQAYTEFRHAIAESDGVLFVTPEHNRSMPAAMKNALDIGSQKRVERQTGGRDQRLALFARRFRGQSPFAPVADVPERVCHAESRNLPEPRRCLVRRTGRGDTRWRAADPAFHRCVCRLGGAVLIPGLGAGTIVPE
jgi:hypothetical protein